MTEAWRLCRRPYADLSGEGARRYGGRWNRRGRPVVYLADHPALAVLEVRVHLDLPLELLPEDFVLLCVALPKESMDAVAALPDDTAAAGDAWLAAGRHAVLRVPSVMVPHAQNLLLNPVHPSAAAARVTAIEAFRFDLRLWRL